MSLVIAAAACASLLAPPFRAQNGATRVYTSPDAVWFKVDGTSYQSGQAFNWPAGSKHELYTEQLQPGPSAAGYRYTLNGWYQGTTLLTSTSTLVVSADPLLPEFHAVFNVEVALNLSFYKCDADSVSCESPGTVYVNGQPYLNSAQIWVPKGSVVTLAASPGAGYVFSGWSSSFNQANTGFLSTVTVSQPMTVTPLFQPARKVQFVTDPPNLQVMPDRTATNTPVTLDWGRGTTHTVSIVSPQQDALSAWWVFQSWSNGKPATFAYTVPDSNITEVLTAKFVPGVRVSFLSNPGGLRFKVDGVDSAQPGPVYNYTWGVGETHKFEALQQQSDAQGRSWQFTGWSDGVSTLSRNVTLTSDATSAGLRFTALYRQLGRISLTSNLPNAPLSVDGAPCATPCTVERPVGTAIAIGAPASVAVGEATRADFQGWNSGNNPAISVIATENTQTFNVNYKLMQRLSLTSDPVGGSAYRVVPDSADGYYNDAATVSVLSMPRPGYRFRRWDGDLTGSVAGGTLQMTGPRRAIAVLDRVPYIPPAGVRNGAGDGPLDGVAPGSVVTITGVNLAADTVDGPATPLAQTLADVTVKMGDTILPLFSVAPDSVSAQLPVDAAPGPATLSVRVGSEPEVRADFLILKNAPGLLRTVVDDRPWAVAAHADGTLVTPDSPAIAGEAITLYGTGFGATSPVRPLGFAIPSNPSYILLDPISVHAGDQVLAADSAAAATGKVGVDAVRFHIPDPLPAGSPLAISVTSGDRESNTVYLPVK